MKFVIFKMILIVLVLFPKLTHAVFLTPPPLEIKKREYSGPKLGRLNQDTPHMKPFQHLILKDSRMSHLSEDFKSEKRLFPFALYLNQAFQTQKVDYLSPLFLKTGELTRVEAEFSFLQNQRPIETHLKGYRIAFESELGKVSLKDPFDVLKATVNEYEHYFQYDPNRIDSILFCLVFYVHSHDGWEIEYRVQIPFLI